MTEAIAMPIRVSRPVAKAHVMRLFSRGRDDEAIEFALAHRMSDGDVQLANDWAARAVAMGLCFTANAPVEG